MYVKPFLTIDNIVLLLKSITKSTLFDSEMHENK